MMYPLTWFIHLAYRNNNDPMTMTDTPRFRLIIVLYHRIVFVFRRLSYAASFGLKAFTSSLLILFTFTLSAEITSIICGHRHIY